MMPTSDIGEEDRPRMRCERSGGRSEAGNEWIVDADLKDFFGSVDHEKLMTLVTQRISDGRVLRLIREHAQGRLLCARANDFRPSRVHRKAG